MESKSLLNIQMQTAPSQLAYRPEDSSFVLNILDVARVSGSSVKDAIGIGCPQGWFASSQVTPGRVCHWGR